MLVRLQGLDKLNVLMERLINMLELVIPKDGQLAAPREIVQNKDGRILTCAELEEWHIQQVLEFTDGNKRKAAELLGISYRTMFNKDLPVKGRVK